MTPEEKAAHIEAKFGNVHTLETLLAAQLVERGVDGIEMNRWQSVPINGCFVPREADIKVTAGPGKVVVLCDGEAFHGPRSVFVAPADRIRDDVTTAEAYFSLGYSVIRYSETEIESGFAVEHFERVYESLRSGGFTRIYRTWHPCVERLVA